MGVAKIVERGLKQVPGNEGLVASLEACWTLFFTPTLEIKFMSLSRGPAGVAPNIHIHGFMTVVVSRVKRNTSTYFLFPFCIILYPKYSSCTSHVRGFS